MGWPPCVQAPCSLPARGRNTRPQRRAAAVHGQAAAGARWACLRSKLNPPALLRASALAPAVAHIKMEGAPGGTAASKAADADGTAAKDGAVAGGAKKGGGRGKKAAAAAAAGDGAGAAAAAAAGGGGPAPSSWWRFDDDSVTELKGGPTSSSDHGGAGKGGAPGAAADAAGKKKGGGGKAGGGGRGRGGKRKGGSEDAEAAAAAQEDADLAAAMAASMGQAPPAAAAAAGEQPAAGAADGGGQQGGEEIVSSNAYLLVYRRRGEELPLVPLDEPQQAALAAAQAALADEQERAAATWADAKEKLVQRQAARQAEVRALVDAAGQLDAGACRCRGGINNRVASLAGGCGVGVWDGWPPAPPEQQPCSLAGRPVRGPGPDRCPPAPCPNSVPPPPRARAPGDAGRFVARDWLQAWADGGVEGEGPGPVDNSPLLCPHGKLDPAKLPGAGRGHCERAGGVRACVSTAFSAGWRLAGTHLLRAAAGPAGE